MLSTPLEFNVISFSLLPRRNNDHLPFLLKYEVYARNLEEVTGKR